MGREVNWMASEVPFYVDSSVLSESPLLFPDSQIDECQRLLK